MKGFFFVLAICLSAAYASPLRLQHEQRIANGNTSTAAFHAVIILVVNSGLQPGDAILGGGSIISVRHVLTSASLVIGPSDNTFQIGFRSGSSFRVLSASVAVGHANYDAKTLANDIALIFLPVGSTFPSANIIGIAGNATFPASATNTTLVSYGFTSPGNNSVSQNAIEANQEVSADATACNGTSSHFCAIDTSSTPAIICLGDGGSGLFSVDSSSGETPGGETPGGETPGGETPGGETPGGETPGGETPGGETPGGETPGGETPGGETPGGTGGIARDQASLTLVGILSNIPDGSCSAASNVAYTRVGLYQNWIQTMTGMANTNGLSFKY